MRPLAALILLMAMQATAADLQLLILTGATTEAAGTPLMEAAKKRVEAASAVLKLAPGFPRLIQSDRIKGLKPGFWIVVAGFCRSDQPLVSLKALDAGAYAKPVQVEDPESCPTNVEGWSATTHEAKDAERRLLRGTLFQSSGQVEEWRLFVSLRDKSGVLLTERVLVESSATRCLQGGDAKLKAKGPSLIVRTEDCAMPRGCPNPGAGTTELTVSAEGDAGLLVQDEVIASPGYGGCRGE